MDTMGENVAETVGAARDGDPEAFRRLVESHSRRIFGLAYRLTGSVEDAEDVVQETFLRAHRQLDRFEERSSFGTWLYRITVNCSHDLMRKRRRHDERNEPLETDSGSTLALPAGGPTADRQVLDGELHRKLAGALSCLSHTERSALILRHYEGLSIAEIGKVLGLGTSAAKHSVFRAVRKLRRELKPLAAVID
jgi:RNA polymerase sigma-70 factor (ECF subfamily)